MPKINVYLPDDLAEAVRQSGVPVSTVCQRALEEAVRSMSAISEGSSLPVSVLGLQGRFTDRVRTMLDKAKEQATRVGHASVGTEHLLLGMLDEGANLGVVVLRTLDIAPFNLRATLEHLLSQPEQPAQAPTPADPQLTPNAREAFRLAQQESLGLGHNYIGCEHILVGLVAEPNGLAGKALRSLGAEITSTRKAVVTALSGFVYARATTIPAGAQPTNAAINAKLDEVLRRLTAIEGRLDEAP